MSEQVRFWNNVKTLMGRKHLTYRELADMLDVSHVTLYQAQNRCSNHKKWLKPMAKALGVKEESLLAETLEKGEGMLYSLNDYYDILKDVREYNISRDKALDKICRLLRDSGIYFYVDTDGFIDYELEIATGLKGSSVIMVTSDKSNFDTSDRILAQESVRDLVAFIIDRINIYFPIGDKGKLYRKLFIYHEVYDFSFNELNNRHIYRRSHSTATKDIEATRNYAMTALNLWEDLSWLDGALECKLGVEYD